MTISPTGRFQTKRAMSAKTAMTDTAAIAETGSIAEKSIRTSA